jgi:hypothetical protein
MSNKIKLAEKYSRIANLLDEVGEHEIADACTVIVNRLASDKSFIKEAAGFNLGGLGKMLGGAGKNMLQGGLLGGLMGSLFPGQKAQAPGQQQAQGLGQLAATNPNLAQAIDSMKVLNSVAQGALTNEIVQLVKKYTTTAQAAAAATPATIPAATSTAANPAATLAAG